MTTLGDRCCRARSTCGGWARGAAAPCPLPPPLPRSARAGPGHQRCLGQDLLFPNKPPLGHWLSTSSCPLSQCLHGTATWGSPSPAQGMLELARRGSFTVIRTPRQSPRGSAAQAHVWDQQSFPGPGQPPVGSPQPPGDSWPQGTSQSSRAGRALPGPGHRLVCPLEPRCACSTVTTTRSWVRSWGSTAHGAQVWLQHGPWCPGALGPACSSWKPAGAARGAVPSCTRADPETALVFHSLGKQQS